MDVFTAISICTGYDGIGLGLKQVIPNFRTICYVEREAYAICNLVAKIKSNQLDDAPIWDDLATFDGRPFKGLVDVFHGGIPCQPWSTAGKQKGIEDERWIWTDVFRIIQEVRPVYVLLEEVPGFVRGGGLGYVLSDLAKAGYDAEWDCFTAAEIGATHKRERLFILAYSPNCGSLRESRHVCKEDGRQGRTLQGQFVGTSELAYSQSAERQHAGVTRSGWDGLTDQSMAYSEQQRLRGRGDGIPAGMCGQVQTERPSELGNAAHLRLQKQCKTGREQMELNGTDEELADTSNEGLQGLRQSRYPARPGQPQYEWEEPRTVEPQMGRTVNGYSSWVDEIRLCGNGVVPDVAALAWTTLTKRLGVMNEQ